MLLCRLTKLSLIAHENLARAVGVSKVYYGNMDYTAIVMELMSTDLYNLLSANAKVGMVPDSRESLIYCIGIVRGKFVVIILLISPKEWNIYIL